MTNRNTSVAYFAAAFPLMALGMLSPHNDSPADILCFGLGIVFLAAGVRYFKRRWEDRAYGSY